VIRSRARDLALTPVPELDDLHALGDHLHQHIRHEERVLFPLIEDALPDDELGQLATVLGRAEHRH
jgi:iron-sulfur cluster repair protein YtfE (RIC family)